ncbi:MAG: glycosyl transferase, group 1 [uncultured bacterium]|nr:MAG: glycosyl transferase, group 1 [uncultured bacterium]
MINSDQKLNIICLSNQLWDFPSWTNKRHVMSRLAKLGHNVLYVDPPINTGNVFLAQIKRKLWDASRLFTQVKKDSSGAFVYTPLNIVPFSQITSQLHIKHINSLAKKHFDPQCKTVLWVYHVQLLQLASYLKKVKYDFLVYDCVDNYEGFPSNSAFYATSIGKENIVAQEKMLAEKANVVFATAPGLVEKLKTYNANTLFMPNVGDYEKFSKVDELKNLIPEDLANIKRPRVGFAGALDEYKFDAKLMKKVAEENPSISFVLIGQMGLKDANASLDTIGLGGLQNIHFLGFRPYEILQNYYAGFDAYIIPYQLNDYTVGGCFPVKFHDALAAGFPTIVTDLPAYYPFADVCYLSKSYDEFSANVKKALDEDSTSRILARRAVAKENNWDGKTQKMLGAILERQKL